VLHTSVVLNLVKSSVIIQKQRWLEQDHVDR